GGPDDDPLAVVRDDEVVQATIRCDLDALEDLAGLAVKDLHVGIAAPPAGGGIDLLAVGSDADAVEPAFFLGMLDFPEDLVGIQVELMECIFALSYARLRGGGSGGCTTGAALGGHVDEARLVVSVVDVVDGDALIARAACPVP